MYKDYAKRFLFCNVPSEYPGKPNDMLIRIPDCNDGHTQ